MAATNLLKKFAGTILGAIILALLMADLAYAAADNAKSPAEPDPNANPMLTRYIKDGMKLYYLGNHSGLDGWFLLKDGQVQVVYTTTDKQSILVGVLYDTDGQPITESAVQLLTSTHPEIIASIEEGLIKSQANMMNTQSPTMNTQSSMMNGQLPMMSSSFVGSLKPQIPPGERLIGDLRAIRGVDVGNSKAPLVYMVMDPNCPHCQATWRALRGAVFKNTLQVRMIPIGRNDEDERAAARLLSVSDPLSVWDKYVDGDKAQLAGTADSLTLGAVKANHTFVDTWSIKETPYMAYRAKDGQVKVVVGEPKKVDALLNDIGP